MVKIQSYGFTLIEILVVISIIGILAALLLANMVGVRERAADARLKNNLNQVKTALRLYYNDTQAYPTSGTCASLVGNGLTSTYIASSVIPADCTYERGATSDSFYACVLLNTAAGTEDNNSATACGAPPGTYGDGYFCVCAQ